MFCSPFEAQEAKDSSLTAVNPLAQLHDQVQLVLANAKLPFADAQEKAIVLMMEDRRKASEDLFGTLMDFTAGPTQGQAGDQMRSAIEWLRGEFLKGLQEFLTPEQLAVWTRFQAAEIQLAGSAARTAEGRPNPIVRQQTQYVRINNNTFTTENNSYVARGSTNAGGAEVIQRGGQGAWHGTGQFFWQSEKLNAGRRFASNKPPYQERQTSFDFSGPLIPGRLTAGATGSQNESKNVDTVRATLADGSIYALGITKPSLNRSLGSLGTFQMTDGNSVTYNLTYQTTKSENNGAGAFVLPERASTITGNNYSIDLKQFSSLSPRSIFEAGFKFSRNKSKTVPVTEALRINVTEAFSSGGAQNNAETTNDLYSFSSLYTRLGEKLTIKTGVEGFWQKNHSITTNNFIGTYTFPSLAAFNARTPINFRVNRGIPELQFKQLEAAFFMQNDLKVTNRFTFLYGVRYQDQTNISDHNNLDGRMGFAYALGRATVIRGGAGLFHSVVTTTTIETQVRQNGTTQYEIVVDNPSYDPANPDPFRSGAIRSTFPSVRVLDPNLATPYNSVVMMAFERTFFSNLFISVLYDHGRDVHRIRTRNLNAPRDITSPLPASCRPEQISEALGCVRPFRDRGNILSYESTGLETSNNIRVNYRQRFSIFNVTANYVMQRSYSDAPINPTQSPTGVGFTTDGLGMDQYDLRGDWARSSFPLHTVNSSVNAQLPFGIFLTQTISANKQKPYTITTGNDDNHDSVVNDRPAGVKRNDTPGPSQITVNYNFSKAFFFGDAPAGGGRAAANGTRKNANFYANITNAFNRPNYGIPSGTMTSPNFRKSTTAANPREIEIGVRYQF